MRHVKIHSVPHLVLIELLAEPLYNGERRKDDFFDTRLLETTESAGRSDKAMLTSGDTSGKNVWPHLHL